MARRGSVGARVAGAGRLPRAAAGGPPTAQPGITGPHAVTDGTRAEAYLRLLRQHHVQIMDREGLLAVAGVTMRRVLVDHARSRTRQKRGGDARPVPLEFSGPLTAHLSLDGVGPGEGSVTGDYSFKMPWPPVEKVALAALKARWNQGLTPAASRPSRSSGRGPRRARGCAEIRPSHVSTSPAPVAITNRATHDRPLVPVHKETDMSTRHIALTVSSPLRPSSLAPPAAAQTRWTPRRSIRRITTGRRNLRRSDRDDRDEELPLNGNKKSARPPSPTPRRPRSRGPAPEFRRTSAAHRARPAGDAFHPLRQRGSGSRTPTSGSTASWSR